MRIINMLKRDNTQYVETYFPPGDERKKLKEGVNYTNETLIYMSPWARAQDITELTEQLVINDLKPFTVVDITSGIGGNVLSFLKSPDIKQVIAFEAEADRRKMLTNNINLYNLGSKAVVMDRPFEKPSQINESLNGAILHIDPPWLPPNVDPELPKDQIKQFYIRKDMKIAGFTIEKLLETLHPRLNGFIARFPYGYELGPVEGWFTEKRDILKKKSQIPQATVYYGVPVNSNGQRIVLENSGMYDPNPVPISIEEKKEGGGMEEKKEGRGMEGLRATRFTKWGEFGNSLPSPSAGIAPLSDQWKREFREYVRAFLSAKKDGNPIIPDEYVNKMVDGPLMDIWTKAVISETYDVNDNYETLEAIGDSLLEYSFKKYLTIREPGIAPSLVSEYKSRYMSKEFQGKWAEQINLHKWLVTGEVPVTVAMYTDVFESFFGALDKVSDTIKFGLGTVSSYNYIVILFQDVEFDEMMRYGTYKTIAVQNYSQLFKWDEFHPNNKIKTKGISDTVARRGNKYVAHINLSSQALVFMRDIGRSVSNPFVKAWGDTDNEARDRAYEFAVKKLIALGVNQNYIDRYRSIRPFVDFDPNLVVKAKQRSGSELLSFKVINKASTKNLYVVQFLATMGDGSLKLLSTGFGTTDTHAKNNAFLHYVSS